MYNMYMRPVYCCCSSLLSHFCFFSSFVLFHLFFYLFSRYMYLLDREGNLYKTFLKANFNYNYYYFATPDLVHGMLESVK